MKNLILLFISSLACSLSAQTNQLNEVHKLMESFNEEQDNSLLAEAYDLIQELFEDEKNESRPKSLLAKTSVLTGLLEHTDVEDPMATCDEIKASYEKALEADNSMKYRNEILTDLYTSKIAMMMEGNQAYESESYEEAHAYYKKCLDMNKLEVEHPRYATVDTSLMFTSAIFANLAGKKDEAAQTFKQLIDWDYKRRDLYDNLMRFYQEKGMVEEATKIGVLRDQRFPPEK